MDPQDNQEMNKSLYYDKFIRVLMRLNDNEISKINNLI